MDGTRVFLAELVREPKFEIIIYCNKKAPVCLFSLAWEKTAGAFKYLVDEESRAKFPTSVGVPSPLYLLIVLYFPLKISLRMSTAGTYFGSFRSLVDVSAVSALPAKRRIALKSFVVL